MKKFNNFVVFGLLASLLLTSCAAPTVEVALLKITIGSTVDELCKSDIEAFEEITVFYTNKDGETTTYYGYALTDILTTITDSSVITFTAADGYTAEMSGTDLLACDDCIIAFQDDGTLRLVMPNQSSKLQVKDLVEIAIK